MISMDRTITPHLAELVEATIARWPAHQRAVEKSFANRDAATLHHDDTLASMILTLAADHSGGLNDFIDDYRFLCEQIILPEEMHFRRSGKYRLSTFEEAVREVYDNSPFMARYMNGLLLSDVFWVNHARGLKHYSDVFLQNLPRQSRMVEIGPGHGLLLSLAGESGKVADLNAWDVSEASLDASRDALRALNVTQDVTLRRQDIFDPTLQVSEEMKPFDGIVLSEVLEHLEDPVAALKTLYGLCKPGGLVWINVPANSPAPDHIYLLGSPEEARDLITAAGFEIVDAGYFPMNDAPLEAAVRKKLTITCAFMARRPPGA